MVAEVIKIIGLILSGIISTLIPCGIAIVKKIKAYKAAKTAEEKEKATNEMLNAVNTFITEAEDTYKDVNDLLKPKGKSAGSAKKDSVMTKLAVFALQNKYIFDPEFWSVKIDNIVAMTRKVNAIKITTSQ